MRGIIAAALILILGGTAHAIGLKEYQLGMSLSDLKRLPPPDLEDFPDHKLELICSDDERVKKERNQFAVELSLDPFVEAVGVTRCAYFLSTRPNKFSGTAMTIAGGPLAHVSFLFLPPDEGSSSRNLYQVWVEFASRDFDQVRAALVAKYGEPEVEGPSDAWLFGGEHAGILLKRAASDSSATILYVDTNAQARVGELKKAAATKAADDL